MDTLTHALSGALVARASAGAASPSRSIPRRIAAGFFACAFPDLDFVIGFLGPVEYLLHHRGVTHSLVMLPLWALAVSWLLAKILREPGGWRALYGVCALAIGTHIAGDLITSFGTIVFAPLSDWRAAIGTTFIIDLWFTGIILAGLAASIAWRRTRVPALAACVTLVGYVSVQWIAKGEAEAFGAQYASAQGLTGARVEALPRAVSPFNWTVYVSDGETHRYAHVNLMRRVVREPRPDDGFVAQLDGAFRPLAAARWETRSRFGATREERAIAREAWDSAALDFLRWFAGKPAFDGVTQGSSCVWFVDLRFVNPGRDWVPFRFGACRASPAASWQAFQRSPGVTLTPLR